MALNISGATVSDLTEAVVEVVNPDPEGPLLVPAVASVCGRLTWPNYDLDGRAAVIATVADALAAQYGTTGTMVSGMGSPESPEHPLHGHFVWTLASPRVV